MHAITHLQSPTAQLQSIHLPAFLSLTQPCLAIVRHSSIDFLAIPSANTDANAAATQQPAPLAPLATVQVNARILRVTPFDVPTSSAATQPIQRLAILTDHHVPRLIVLQAETLGAHGQYRVTSIFNSRLVDAVRPPAEMGLGVWTARAQGSQLQDAIVAHTHSGALKITPATREPRSMAMSFTGTLPHPRVVSVAPLDPPSSISWSFPPAIAVLSISSTPSKLPGLGAQCLPVLTFHQIDHDKRRLLHLPWGLERKVPPAQSPATASRRRSSQHSGGAAEQASSRKGKGRGAKAIGNTLTPDQARAREADLARSNLGQAHVSLPFADALGAHLITALPSAAGGAVIVWGETSVLVVQPPAGLYPQDDWDVPEQSSPSSSKAQGKRRKAGDDHRGDNGLHGTSPDSAVFSHSPSSHANEHGKRRRSSLKKAAESSSAVDERDPTSKAGPSDSPRKFVRLSLPRPVQFVAADIVREGNTSGVIANSADELSATLNILFATTAGCLHRLEVTLSRDHARAVFSPTSMHATKIGSIPTPSGPASLTYLGEGFVHVASASGDSALVQLTETPDGAASDSLGGDDDVDMVSPPTSPIAIRVNPPNSAPFPRLHTRVPPKTDPLPDFAQSKSLVLHTIHTTPSLAPALDFVIDGDVNGPSAGAQARIVAACGTGSDGALALVKNGVAVEELGGIQYAGTRRLWSVKMACSSTGLICAGAGSTGVLRLSSAGIEDITDSIVVDEASSSTTVECGSLVGGAWARATERCLIVHPKEGKPILWKPGGLSDNVPCVITAAHIQDDLILLGVTGNHVVLLRWDHQQSGFSQQTSVLMSDEVSDLHVSHGIAAVGQWSTNTVRLLQVPTLVDVTPADVQPLPALPRSVLIHSFTEREQGDGDGRPKPYLFVGLTNGAVVSFALLLPDANSLSQTVGLTDKKICVLGHQPLRLLSFVTTLGKRAVLASSGGEAPTVIWAQDGRVTYSALGYPSATSAAHVATPDGEGTLAIAFKDRIELVSVGEIGRLDINKVSLGFDNPVSITGVGKTEFGHYEYFVVLTCPFRPEGSATREDRPAKVLVFEGGDMQKIAEVHLDPMERPNSVSTCRLGGQDYVIVGTGYAKPEESEVMSGRVLGFTLDGWTGRRNEWDERELKMRFAQPLEGNVYAVACVDNKLIAAINSDVVSFAVERFRRSVSVGDLQVDGTADALGPDDKLALREISCWTSAYVATTISPLPSDPHRIVVGDALRSMSVVYVNGETGSMTEYARDCDPFWSSACAVLDSKEQLFIGADISFNLYTTQRTLLSGATKRCLEQAEETRRQRAAGGDEAAAALLSSSNLPPTMPRVDLSENGKWSHIMERRAAWHYGDLINQFRPGALVSRATMGALGRADETQTTTKMATMPIDPRMIFCTASGAIGVISQLDGETGELLSKVQRNLESVLDERDRPQQQRQWMRVSGEHDSTTLNAGSVPYEEWRRLRTDHRESGPAGFLDGDLLLHFTRSLSVADRMRVLSGGGQRALALDAGLRDRVEDLIDGLGRVC